MQKGADVFTKRDRRIYRNDLSPNWKVDIGDGRSYEMRLPGTLDENGIGHADTGSNQWHPDAELGNAGEGFDGSKEIATRFTRKRTFEGCAKISRSFSRGEIIGDGERLIGKRYFLEVERARALRLFINGAEVEPRKVSSISAPYVYEITDKLGDEDINIEFWSDNSYPGMPKGDILYSSAATDETQTNWNGLLGFVRIREENGTFIDSVKVFPSGSSATVKIVMSTNANATDFSLVVSSKALVEKYQEDITLEEGENELVIENLALAENIRRWDEKEGNLYELSVQLFEKNSITTNVADESKDQCLADEKTINFGVRDFGANEEGRLTINGRVFFLRGEANCAVFPEEGHTPMDEERWMQILKIYASYGVNCMRFHSHCPPEAAFAAADKLGMMMQPELSNWNPRDAFGDEKCREYYKNELISILDMLANHPSFVMLTLGNELQASEDGHRFMSELLTLARDIDPTRLYADGSNTHYGEIGCDADSDFYASQKYYEAELRGTYANMEGFINNEYPTAMHDYETAMQEVRKTYKKPVFTFEVGQFEVLPEFSEIESFKGVTRPVNYRIIREKVEKKGLLPKWKKYVEATGEISRIGYREEVEAVLRTKSLSGISLLGLQDFPGQGTALVGMLNSHLEPKPYSFARPERFASFYREQLPLVMLPGYTYSNADTLEAEVKIANYGKSDLVGEVKYQLAEAESERISERPSTAEKGQGIISSGSLGTVNAKAGDLTNCEQKISIKLEAIDKAMKAELTVRIGSCANTYPVWIYPEIEKNDPEIENQANSRGVSNFYETRVLDDKAIEILKSGGRVLFAPDSDEKSVPRAVKAQFTTDFWSVGTFATQSGAMGQLINNAHPVFKDFPTEFHTNWQWWKMANTYASILPEGMSMDCAIVTEMDSYAYLRNMVQLMECRVGKGKLMFSSFGLHNSQEYPEARALLNSIYNYMESDEFDPAVEFSIEEIEGWCRGN